MVHTGKVDSRLVLFHGVLGLCKNNEMPWLGDPQAPGYMAQEVPKILIGHAEA